MKTLQQLHEEKMVRWNQQLENGIDSDYYADVIDDYDKMDAEYWAELTDELGLSEEEITVRQIYASHNKIAYEERAKYLGYYLNGMNEDDVRKKVRLNLENI